MLAINNTTSKISIGERLPNERHTQKTISKHRSSGFVLETTPHVIINRQLINLSINFTKFDYDQLKHPARTERSIKTSITIKNGETIVIGGPMNKKVDKSVSQLILFVTADIISKDTNLQKLLKNYRKNVETLQASVTQP